MSSLAFSLDSARLAIGTQEGHASLLDVEGGGLQLAHSHDDWVRALAFSPGDQVHQQSAFILSIPTLFFTFYPNPRPHVPYPALYLSASYL